MNREMATNLEDIFDVLDDIEELRKSAGRRPSYDVQQSRKTRRESQ